MKLFIYIIENVPFTEFCGIELNEYNLKAFLFAVKSQYLYQMYIDNFPLWGMFVN